MKLVISKQIHVFTKNEKVILELVEQLTRANPEYHKMKALKKPVWDIPRDIEMFIFCEGGIVIPRGCMNLIREVSTDFSEPIISIISRRTKGHSIDVELNFNDTFKNLLVYQKQFISALSLKNNGVGVMPCGSGKSIAGLGLIALKKISALIIVHTSELFDQWYNEIVGDEKKGVEPKLTGNFTVGQIGRGKKTIGGITIAMIQTLNKYTDEQFKELNKKVGIVMMDECFHYDSYIDVKNGSRKIGDIVENKEFCYVDSYNKKTGVHELKKITRHFKIKRKDNLLEVVFSHSNDIYTYSMFVTENHEFPDEHLKDKKIKDFHVGDYFFNGVLIHSIQKAKWKDQPEYVYNIEVEDNHNYFVFSILTNNCHHTPANTFLNIIKKFSAKYIYGLSATPNRKDRKEFALYSYIGPILFSMTEKELEKHNRLVPVKLNFVNTGREFDFKEMDEDWATLTRFISKDVIRNDIILNTIIDDIKGGRFPMVLCNRKNHAYHIKSLLANLDYNVGLLTSDVDKFQRKKTKEEAVNGELDAIVCIDKIAGEGLDIPLLDSVHICFLVNNKAGLQQFIGRGRRVTPDKKYCQVYLYKDYIYYKRLNNKIEHRLGERIYKNQLGWFKKWEFEITEG